MNPFGTNPVRTKPVRTKPAHSSRCGASRPSLMSSCVLALALAVFGTTPAITQGMQPETELAGVVSIDELARDFDGVRVFTKASKDAEIGFQLPTSIVEVLVKGGQAVEPGQPMIQGDDEEERATVQLQRVRSDSDLAEQRAREQLELAKLEEEQMEEAFANGAATPQQMNRARVSVKIAQIDVSLAEWNRQQETLNYERMLARAERLTLKAPFAGRVDQVVVDEGDTVQESTPVIRVVQIDPLHIDVNTPVTTSMRLGLKEDRKAWALIDVPGKPVVLEARVIEVAPVAEFASRKQRIRVEVANPEGLPPGLAAWVRFTEPGQRFLDMMPEATEISRRAATDAAAETLVEGNRP